jgi:hypothetical protein
LYLVNPDTTNIKPWLSTNQYFDTELAHENFYPTVVHPGTGVPCTLPNASGTPSSICVPNTTTYYVTANSLASSNTLDFKWVRINHKTNASQNDMANGVTPGTVYPRMVDQNRNAAADFNAPVCFDLGTNAPMSTNAPTSFGKQMVLPAGETLCMAHPGTTVQWQPVYVLTALAVTPSGARRMLQADVARVILPPMPASLTLDGPIPATKNYDDFSSNGAGIVGIDAAANACGPDKPAIGTYDVASSGLVNLKRAGNDTGLPGGVSSVAGTLGPLSTVDGLKALVAAVSSMADYTGTGNSTPIGTSLNPKITVVNGDFDLSTSGGGVLLVTGNFTVKKGNATWDGLILVIGTGNMTQDGGSVINGSVLVANITTDAYGNPLTGPTPGPPTFNGNGGGKDGGIKYDSCKSTTANNFAPFRVIGMKELPY